MSAAQEAIKLFVCLKCQRKRIQNYSSKGSKPCPAISH